jgi:hypothetical protein
VEHQGLIPDAQGTRLRFIDYFDHVLHPFRRRGICSWRCQTSGTTGSAR